MEKLSDNALMLQVKDGDIDRLGLLFERYKRPLFGFFYSLNKDNELSEDLVQNVFFRILKYRYLFRGASADQTDGSEFKTWMFHIARNVSKDHHRKNKRNKSEPLELWQERLNANDPHMVQLQQTEELQLMHAALDRLPADKKEVLLLSKFQEMKYREIGNLLGCSENTVKVKVFRALKELAEIYKQMEKYV